MIGRLWIGGLLLTLAAAWAASQDDSAPPASRPALDANGFPLTASAPGSEPSTEPEDFYDPNEPFTQPASGPGSQPATGPREVRPAGRGGAYGRSGNFDRSRFGRDRSDRTDRSRFGGGGPSGLGSVRPTATTGTSLEDFAVLTTRNIFVKDRRVREPIGPFGPPPPPPPPPESFILTGTAQLDSDLQQSSTLAAFFEDVNAGRLIRVTAGQVLDGGKIVSISLDTVVYEKGGTTRRIGIGGGLSGGGRMDLSTRPAVVEGGTSTSGPSGGGDAEERMRRRRMEQIK